MKWHTFMVLGATLLVTACSTTYNKSQKTGGLQVNVQSDLEADVDVDMSKKIQGTVHHTRLLGLFDIKKSNNFADGVEYGTESFSFFGPGMISEAKSAAAYKAVTPAKADVLVAPQYYIKVKSYFFGAWKEVTAQVSGYAGRIKTIKKKQSRGSVPSQLADAK